MAERDAFGREKGEDTLAELGWRATAPPEPAIPADRPPEPQPRVPDPVAHVAESHFEPAPAPSPRVRRRRRRPVIRLILFVAFAGVVIWGVGPLLQLGRDAADELESAVREAVPTVVEPPAGLEKESLFRHAALRDALAQLPAGDIQSLRVAPERIDAQVVADGKLHIVQVTSDGRVSTVEASVGAPGEAVRVNAAAPQRIVRTAARRAGRSPEAVSYLVLMSIGGKSEWQLFFDDGLHFSANSTGKKVRKVG
jgi:hypothetical protein